MSTAQESYYATLAKNLITEIEASELYRSTWEALGDFVSSESTTVCREFEDRTNADALWVRFSNCITLLEENSFEDMLDSYKQAGDVLLESRHQYEDKFVLYGYQEGHTYFYALMPHGEYLNFVNLETRTAAGQIVENVFSESVDDFIYGVLMINAQR